MNVINFDWQTADGIILEEAAKSAIINFGNILVVAGPGSGKTELLAQKAFYIFKYKKIKQNRKILAISFKRDSAKNLLDRIEKRVSHIDKYNFHSLTYDAFAKGIVDQFILSINDDFVLDSDYQIDNEINQKIRNISEMIYGKELSQFEISSIIKKLNSSIITNIGKNGLLLWQQLLKEKSVSFPMLTLLAIHIMQKNPLIVKCFLESYEYVFLDEFQDTTTIQYELIKTIFDKSKSKITAVGDNKQRIMTWAGADKEIFRKFITDYKAESVELIFNYRSAPKLVEFQKEVYSVLNETLKDIKVNPKWRKTDGTVKLVEFKHEQNEADFLLTDFGKKIREGIKPNEMCILVKQRPEIYTSCILKKMKEYNVNVRIETEYQDLMKENIIILILSLFNQIFDSNNYESFITLIDYIDNSQFKDLNLSEYEKIDESINRIKGKFNYELSRSDFDNLIIEIIGFLDITKIKSIYREYTQGEYLNQCITKFKSIFYNEYEKANRNIVEAINNFTGDFSTPIMTIHKSKGLEYKVVYFVGLEDDAFWNFTNQPLEDKCAFFVALSRAKNEVVFTFCNSRTNISSRKQSHEKINEIYKLLIESNYTEYIRFE